MYRLVCFFFFLTIGLSVSAQRVYYVYLQTEKEQPFMVKMADKVYISSSTGYLILSRLADSTYNFSVGFPGNAWPDQQFAVTIDSKNHGFLLKHFTDEGWGLFNLQTLVVTLSQSATTTVATIKEPVAVSDFTNILSKAANDPSLKQKTVITPPAAEEKKATPVKDEVVQVIVQEKPVIATKPDSQAVTEKKQGVASIEEKAKDVKKLDSIAVASSSVINETNQKEEAKMPLAEIQPTVYRPSLVTKKTESSTTQGFGLVFIDQYADGHTDTISILIPPVLQAANKDESPKNNDQKFLDIPVVAQQPVNPQEEQQGAVIKQSVCKSVATEDDFKKLRKRMAAKNTDDGMLDEAKKALKQKCYTTSQLKNLGTLFLNDAARYQFFDAAYFYTSDRERFLSLETEFKNEYYLRRFKAIVQP